MVPARVLVSNMPGPSTNKVRDSYPLALLATHTKAGARSPTRFRKAGLDTLTEANPI